MKIIRLAVERPVTTMMFYLAVTLIGIISILMLPQEMFPTVSFPQLLVVTRYGAAAPEEIENIITKLVEEQAGTVPNLKSVRSISREGRSVVMLEFNWGTDMGLAHLSVREKIDLIKDRLPSEAEEPIVQRYNPFAQPMLILSISGSLPLVDMTRMANDVVKKRLQKVDGVASASISGGQMREIWVEVDLEKMQASNISISGIVDSLKQSNVNYPAGTTQGRFYEYLVRTIGEFKDVREIGRTVIAVDTPRDSPEFQYKWQAQKRGAETFQPRAQRLIPLRDIATINDTFREPDSFSRHNGKTNISIAIQKQFDANTVQTSRRIIAALNEIRISLPKEMRVEVVYDESEFIKNSLGNVCIAAVQGGFLAFVVLLFFLRNVRESLIVTVTIPVSMIVVFLFLYFMGRSINVIALAGLALGIGSMIDNSIAVLENIVRFRKKVPNPVEAAVRGPEEIAVAQIASMLTNVAVFFPLLFAKGLAQQLFKDLFYAAVIANIAALVVALTLIPRIMAYSAPGPKDAEPESGSGDDVLIGVGGVRKAVSAQRPEPAGPLPVRWVKSAWFWLIEGLTPERAEKLKSSYKKLLTWSLDNRRKVAMLILYAMIASLAIFYFKSKIFMPAVDQGQFLQKINMPVGSRLIVTNRVVGRIEEVLGQMPEIKDYMARIGAGVEDAVETLGPHQGELIVTLDRRRTKESTEQVLLKVTERLESVDLEGGEIESVIQGSSMKGMGGGSAPIAITVKGPDLGALRTLSDDLQNRLRGVPGVQGVKTSLPLPSYETRVHIDKDRASGFGLSVSEISRASLIAIRGFVGTFFKEEGKEIPIRVRLREEDRAQPSAVQRVAIRNSQGVMVTLGDVANVSAGYGPSQIQRIDQQRAIVVTAHILGRSFGEVMQDVEAQVTQVRLPKDYSLEIGGAKKEMEESFGGLVLAFILAVVLIYMIMAAGFESLLHPFLIMFTVPLGLIGVAFILFVTFTPLSAPVILGVVLLGGIVVNNGIVLIDQINLLRKQGFDIHEAVVQGCTNRLNPVLMSALTTILSLIPVAIGFGEGTEVSAPMALATLGGLLVSTALTLIVIPLVYSSVEEYRLRGTVPHKGLAPHAGQA